MNRTIKSIGLLILALSLIASASAATVPGAGTTPDNTAAWQMELAWERVRTALTFNEEAKATYLLERAEERSLELEEIELNANAEELTEREQAALERGLRQHERQLEQARSIANRSDNLNVTKNIEDKAESVSNTHLEVLKSLRSRLPEEAHEGIDTAIERAETTTRQARANVEEIERGQSNESRNPTR